MAPLHVSHRRTVAGLVDYWASVKPEEVAVIYEDSAGDVQRLSWAELHRAALGVGHLLRSRGIRPTDRVHVHMRNCPEFIVIWLACAHVGAILVPSNPGASGAELKQLLADSGSRLSFVAESSDEQSGVFTVGSHGIHDTVFVASRAWETWCETGEAGRLDGRGRFEEVAILYTSGTTSRPKGVVVTNEGYVHAGESVARHLAVTESDRLLAVLPLFHANAQYYSVMTAWVSGASLVLVDKFSASRFFDVAQSHGATLTSLFSAPIRMILAQEDRPSWRAHQLRGALFAQRLSRSELDCWRSRTGVDLLQLWGMTETMGPPLVNPLVGRRRNESVGRPTLGFSCRIVDSGGQDVCPGDVGELLVGGVPGVSLTKGYYKNPAATADLLRAGWLHSGDLVREDEEGYVHFVDRVKDMIKVAGENVAASEVEVVILEHPDVVDVAVIGAPDPMRDEMVVAFVVVREDARVTVEDVRDWCAARTSRFRVPTRVELVPALPRTSVGKIQKVALRELAAQDTDSCTGIVAGEG